MTKRKLMRITTSDISLDSLIKGQLRFMNQYFEVIGVSNNTGVLENVGRREGVRVIEVPMHREISLLADFKCLWKLYRLLRKERPFIVHANTPKGSLLAMIAGKLARIRHRIYTVTGLRYQGAGGRFRWLLMTMERISCFCATKVIPEGNGVKKSLIGDHITGKPLQVIHNGNINGIDTDYFSVESLKKSGVNRREFRTSLNLADDDFVFIFIGRIVKDKGMNELASCMKEFKKLDEHVKLILVGTFETALDPLKGDNETFFKQSSNVRFVGHQGDVRPFLWASDALVFPSYREGFPNVVLQAGAMGLASIVTNINGCNEIIQNNENGVIIEPKKEDNLMQTMRQFAYDCGDVRRMASNARKMIIERYEQKDVWNAHLRMYQNL